MSGSRYLSEDELKHVIPSGKRILRDEAWDRRYENYWIGVTAPTFDGPLNEDESYYWYDVAQDVVKKFNHLTKDWVIPPATETIPKLAFETKTWRHVGRVVDDDATPTKKSLSELLAEDDVI